MKCAMCQYEFDEDDLACHTSCPMSKGCAVICCPQCGYSTVDTGRSVVATWVMRLKRLGQRSRAGGRAGGDQGAEVATPEGQAGVPLTRLDVGEEGVVAEVGTGDRADGWETLFQLSQYGIVPGVAVRLCKKRPVPVVRVGETEVALEREVAGRIRVSTGG